MHREAPANGQASLAWPIAGDPGRVALALLVAVAPRFASCTGRLAQLGIVTTRLAVKATRRGGCPAVGIELALGARLAAVGRLTLLVAVVARGALVAQSKSYGTLSLAISSLGTIFAGCLIDLSSLVKISACGAAVAGEPRFLVLVFPACAFLTVCFLKFSLLGI